MIESAAATLEAPARFGALRSIAPLVLAVAIITAGGGLLTTQMSLQLTLNHASVGATGAVVTGGPVGFLIGCLSARFLISHFGHGRIYQLMALLAGAASAAFVLSNTIWAWTFLRGLGGFAMATMFTSAESWINLDSGPDNRGTLLSFYMVMGTLGLSVGQALISLGDPAGGGLFLLAGAISASGALPFLADGRLRPQRRGSDAAGHVPDEAFSVGRLFAVAPVVLIAAAQTGMSNMTFGVMAPIYAVKSGHSPGIAAAIVTLFSAGGLAAQVPLGLISDRLDRRLLLVMAGVLAALTCALIVAFGQLSTWLLMGLVFFYGMTSLSIYPLAIAHAGSLVQSRFLVAISGRFLLFYAFGSIVAPAISNELMARFGVSTLFTFLGVICAITAIAAGVEFLSSRQEVRQ